VYDGDPGELIPSRRWEGWREGVEDYTEPSTLRARHLVTREAEPHARSEDFWHGDRGKWSIYPYYGHAALTMKQRPTVRLRRPGD
jgi:hypothetical protein